MMFTILLLIIASISNAIMDILDHRWSSSIFTLLAKHKHSFWASKTDSWVRKYKNYDRVSKIPAFPLATTVLVAFTDAWHLFKEIMLSSFSLALAINLEYPVYYSTPTIRILIGIVFELFYSTNIFKIKTDGIT